MRGNEYKFVPTFTKFLLENQRKLQQISKTGWQSPNLETQCMKRTMIISCWSSARPGKWSLVFVRSLIQ